VLGQPDHVKISPAMWATAQTSSDLELIVSAGFAAAGCLDFRRPRPGLMDSFPLAQQLAVQPIQLLLGGRVFKNQGVQQPIGRGADRF